MNNTLTYNRHNDKTMWTYYVSIVTNLLIIDTIINLSITLLYLSNYEQTVNKDSFNLLTIARVFPQVCSECFSLLKWCSAKEVAVKSAKAREEQTFINVLKHNN